MPYRERESVEEVLERLDELPRSQPVRFVDRQGNQYSPDLSQATVNESEGTVRVPLRVEGHSDQPATAGSIHDDLEARIGNTDNEDFELVLESPDNYFGAPEDYVITDSFGTRYGMSVIEVAANTEQGFKVHDEMAFARYQFGTPVGGHVSEASMGSDVFGDTDDDGIPDAFEMDTSDDLFEQEEEREPALLEDLTEDGQPVRYYDTPDMTDRGMEAAAMRAVGRRR